MRVRDHASINIGGDYTCFVCSCCLTLIEVYEASFLLTGRCAEIVIVDKLWNAFEFIIRVVLGLSLSVSHPSFHVLI